jgi:hypothetical protein
MTGDISVSHESEIYNRVCKLLIVDKNNNAMDLSDLRIKFSIKHSGVLTPNVAEIQVYNLSEATAKQLSVTKEFNRIILQAGYIGNYGIIFQGNIKQVLIGRESGQDTFVTFLAGDGDRAYNYAIVNATVAAGSTQTDQLSQITSAFNAKGVNTGYMTDLPVAKLPRGKVMYGEAKKYLRKLSTTSDMTAFIQDEALVFIPKKAYLKYEQVILTSKTGMIGTPQQTTEGINVKSMLSPLYKIGGLVKLDNKSIEKFKINFSVPGSPANIPASISADGVYYILISEFEGDTRGQPWYSNLVCLNQDPSSSVFNSVQVNQGGGI